MHQLKLSAHSLDKYACPFRGYLYRVLGRVPAEVLPARVQGIAGHRAIALWRQGKSVVEQQDAVMNEFSKWQIPADDYRTPQYLLDVLVQYRAEYSKERWEWEEVETPFEVPMGVIQTRRLGEVEVVWTGRRDAVGYSPGTGERYVFDEKFMSRDESAELSAARNSCALKGYVWSWLRQKGGQIRGAVLRRTIIRKPIQKTPLNYTLPLDPPIYFDAERLEEWRRNVLIRAGEIAERDPEHPEEWPMCETLCRGTYGCCDYLPVCCMPPGEDRIRLLRGPGFADAHQDG